MLVILRNQRVKKKLTHTVLHILALYFMISQIQFFFSFDLHTKKTCLLIHISIHISTVLLMFVGNICHVFVIKCIFIIKSYLAYCQGAHVTITARSPDDVEESIVLDKVKKASGTSSHCYQYFYINGVCSGLLYIQHIYL